MMYYQKLAVAIKSNGKILRETKDLVHLPFGSEFSVLVKNLNSRRVKFTLHIDGADALDGTEIIVNANSETEVKRFIRNGNMDEGNAFKFIERTQAIEDGPRGIKVDDGVVRIEFWFEEEQPVYTKTVHVDEYYRRYMPPIIYGGPYYGSNGQVYGSLNVSGASGSLGTAIGSADASIARGQTLNQIADHVSYSAKGATAQSTTDSAEKLINDAGITVPGSKVEQKFHTVYGFKAESHSDTIILKLVGKNGTVEITEPITVAHKPECVTCGKLNKANSKFCSACGTALTLF